MLVRPLLGCLFAASLSFAASAQDTQDVVGTYICKERGKECLHINADHTFGRYLRCKDEKPDITGTWDMRPYKENRSVVALDSKELHKQGCGPDELDCQLIPGKQLGRRFLLWNGYTYWELKNKD